MKRLIIKQAIAAIFAVLFLEPQASDAQTQPGIFYAITSKGSKDTSWLFGTYHLIGESYLKELPAVSAAFNKAKAIVVEVVIDSADLMQANEKALLQNKKLTDLLDGQFTDSLDRELKATLGQGIEQYQPLKPMAVVLTLSMVNLMKDNQAILKKYKGLPLDAFFAATGKSTGKTVIPLETIGQQMDLLFNSTTDEQQAQMLQQFLRNKQDNIRMGNELLNVYFENNLARIYSIYQESVRASGDRDYLITERNREWMKTIPSIIKKKPGFIAVGALHLTGPEGLVEQLRKAGYQVTAQNVKSE